MDIKIINLIDISGEEVLVSSLPEEKRKIIAEMLQERMMIPIGYKRKSA